MLRRQANILKHHSFFLFGARGTGKTTLLNDLFKPSEALRIDLLDPNTFGQLQANPSLLLPLIQPAKSDGRAVIIDDVQKIPALLDLVHLVIERDKIVFGLTGSSARKLRRGSANLLAGRAYIYKLYPLLASAPLSLVPPFACTPPFRLYTLDSGGSVLAFFRLYILDFGGSVLGISGYSRLLSLVHPETAGKPSRSMFWSAF